MSEPDLPGNRSDGAEESGASERRGVFRSLFSGGDLGLLPVALALIFIWIIFQSTNQVFLSPRNLSNLVLQIAVIGTLALGETLILLIAEIDLAIAQFSGAAAALLAVVSVNLGWPFWASIPVVLLAGALYGFAQGTMVTRVGVPSFIVTLAGSLVSLGILLALLAQQGTQLIYDPFILGIASSYVPGWAGWVLAALVIGTFFITSMRTQALRRSKGLTVPPVATVVVRVVALTALVIAIVLTLNAYRGVPVAGILLVGFVALFAYITKSTPYGRHLYAVGGNGEAARRAGINVTGLRLSIFVLASTFAAAGGIIGASRLGAASTTSGGANLLLEVVGSAVIGGTSLFGGRGDVYGALIGALVIGSVENGMDLLGAPSSTRFLVEGAILLAAVTLDTVLRRQRLRAGRA